ncbi:hypothetical protein Ae406Ps2_2411c [Pseudonocardia sp. Ae406_Ps2]|nr:hypothetical protein Ae331Ps2_3506 [Pseudonocardia sp. Ae331_Ps2]OLM02411.1 hypothetical protein Ae406Ps2_2411c [Pseudonocardia sp. Ae406_Ps2]OLM12753.1 hypothetical protein Ae505Ps2_2881 [Pseudonocardia sp. Ae505_Ps2]OLM23982.1 hypothetical protein Ae706Ps2_2415c [Pseudonocardia sp. Ae706_Ps2]
MGESLPAAVVGSSRTVGCRLPGRRRILWEPIVADAVPGGPVALPRP